MSNNKTSKAKKLVKNTALYAISNFGSKILVFLIVPLYTYYLSTAEYGEYDTIISLVHLISPLCILAINEGVLRWLLTSKDNEKEIASNGLAVYICLAIMTNVIMGAIYFFTRWKYSLIMALLLTFTSLNTVLQFCSRGVKKNTVFAASGVIQTISMILLNVIMVICCKLGIYGMLYSYLLSQVLSCCYLVLNLKSIFSFKAKIFDRNIIKQMLLYSIMLVPNNISWWIMNSSDKLMLTTIIGASFTGIYSIATKFPSIVNLIHNIFYSAWQEQAVIEYSSKDRDEYYSDIFNIYMKLIFFLAIIMIPTSKLFILLFMNTEFKIAYKYVGVLMVGTVFSAISSFYGTGYVSRKDSKNATATTMVGAIVNCLINLLFIKYIGIWAACISTVVGYFTTWIIRLFQTKKYFNIEVNWKIFFVLLFTITVYTIVNMSNEFISSVFLIVLSIALMIIISKKEINLVKDYIKNRKKSN